MPVRHRCLVAVSPRLLGGAVARLLRHEGLDVVVDDGDGRAASAEPYTVVITSLGEQRAPSAQVQVTLAPQGSPGPAVVVRGPGQRRRELAVVAELLPVLVALCDDLAAEGAC